MIVLLFHTKAIEFPANSYNTDGKEMDEVFNWGLNFSNAGPQALEQPVPGVYCNFATYEYEKGW